MLLLIILALGDIYPIGGLSQDKYLNNIIGMIIMGYYPTPPPPPREDPILRILRELVSLNNKFDQLSKDLANINTRVEGLESRVNEIEKTLSSLVKAQELIAGVTPQNITELAGLLSNTLRELTRIEASLIAYRDSISSIQNKLENAMDLLAKVSTDLREYRALDVNQVVEISNQLASVNTRLNELQKLLEEQGIRLVAEYRKSSEIIEGLKSVILDLLGKVSGKT
jgi:chromosome segregation ATPase